MRFTIAVGAGIIASEREAGMAVDVGAMAAWMARRRAEAAQAPKPEPVGIDFARFARERYERATPEERARIDAHRIERARVEATRAEIPAVFERFEFRAGRREGDPGVRRVARTWERPVGIQIEGGPGEEIVRFTGAVTGHESFRIDEEFCRLLDDEEENRLRPRFYVCAGTPGRWDGCSVDPADVAAYLRERRPAMFGVSPPSP